MDVFLSKQRSKALQDIKDTIDYAIQNLEGEALEQFCAEATKEIQELTKVIRDSDE